MATILETSDAPAGVQTSYQLQIGDRFLGKMGGSDVDWLRIDLVAGQVVTFAVVGLGGPGLAVADPKMWLRNANGALIQAEDDFGPGLMPMLTHTADRTGAHFVSVRALDAGTDYGVVVVAGDRLRLDADFAAGMLYREGASWAATPGEPVTLTWSFRDTGPAQDANGRSAMFSRLSEAQQAAMAEALQAYAAVCGVSFSQVNPGGFSNQATLRFGAYSSSSDGSGAYAYLPGSTAASANAGDLWLNRTSVGDDFAPGSYGRYVLLHELGHSMGLAHPGDYNAGASSRPITYETDAQYVEDSGQYTVMSYFDAVKTEGAAPPIHAQTLMMHDIRALQVMYGANQAHNAGATVYGFGATEAGSVYDFAVNSTPLLCIWDGGGRDMLDVSGFGGRQKIDLQAGHFSDIGGFKGNVSIALDCVIEDATGGRGADLILGNAAGNRLFGRGGADTIEGGAGADTLFGGAGADVLTGGTGRDTFVFGAGHGQDRITDMDVLRDILRLGADLWGGLSKTAAEVLEDFARSEDGHLVLDFGADELHLMNLTSEAGLSGRIVLI